MRLWGAGLTTRRHLGVQQTKRKDQSLFVFPSTIQPVVSHSVLSILHTPISYFHSRLNTAGDTSATVYKLSDTPIWLYYWMRAGNHQTRRVRSFASTSFLQPPVFQPLVQPRFDLGWLSCYSKRLSLLNPLAVRIHVLHSTVPYRID